MGRPRNQIPIAALTARVPQAFADDIRALADRHGMSVSHVIRVALRKMFRDIQRFPQRKTLPRDPNCYARRTSSDSRAQKFHG